MKVLTAGLLACVLLLTGLLLLEKADQVVNGPPPADVQRDSLPKRLTRAIANWLIDRGMRDGPPQRPNARETPQPALAVYAPTPSEFLSAEDQPLDYATGW